MTDTFSKEQRRKTMQAIKSERTKLEEKITNALWRKGFRFRKNVKTLKGKPDIAIKKYKVVIFLDSCFWHGCKKHCRYPSTNREYWHSKINRNMQRDKEVTDYYLNNDWNILRIWEHDIKENFDESIDRIKQIILKSKEVDNIKEE